MKRKAFFIIAAFVFIIEISSAQVLMHTVNLDFEEGLPGVVPYGWYIPPYAQESGYYAYLTDENPAEGRYSLTLAKDTATEKDLAPFGSVMQSIEAEPYLGKRVKIRAAVKAMIESDTGSAHLWIKEHLVNDQEGFFDMMEEDPIVINEWDYYEIEAEISPYARQINFGLALVGTGKAWIDDVSIEILDDEKDIAPPAILSGQYLRNMISFAKIYGNIRYFYAGREASQMNWQKFLLHGVKYIEDAENDAELMKKLRELFEPIAPAMKIFKSRKSKREIMDQPPGALEDVALGWMHKGPAIGVESQFISSRIVNVLMPQRENEGMVVQVVNADEFRGKKIELDIAAKTDLIKPFSQVQLWIRADDEHNKFISAVSNKANPITGSKWERYSLEYDVPDSASVIQVGLVLIGNGKAWFDDGKISVYENDKKIKEIELRNGSFEEEMKKGIVPQWRLLPESKRERYTAKTDGTEYTAGEKSLLMHSDPMTRIHFPEVGELYEFNLIGAWKCSYPLNVFVDSLRTLPIPKTDYKEPGGDNQYSGNDRYSRFAITIMLWNIYKNFNLYADQNIWDDVLSDALKKSSEDISKEDFLKTLRRMTYYLNDGQARVWHPDLSSRYGFPFLWKMIDGEVYITEIDDEYEKDILPGSVIKKINGQNISDLLDSLKLNISGATERWKNIRALAMLRSGKKESEALIEYETPDGKTKEKKLKRNMFLTDLSEYRPSEFYMIDTSYYYIDLTRLDDDDLKDNFKMLSGAEGIIFDVRGVMLTSEHILGFFIENAVPSCKWLLPVYTKPDKGLISQDIFTNDIVPKPHIKGCKAVFLADNRTIGYGEAMLSIVKEYNIGEIIGESTAGTAGEHLAFRLPGNYYVSMTAMRVLKPDGTDIQGLGVDPDVLISPSPSSIKDQDDEAYERAKKIIKK